jgi:hypothetical protein
VLTIAEQDLFSYEVVFIQEYFIFLSYRCDNALLFISKKNGAGCILNNFRKKVVRNSGGARGGLGWAQPTRKEVEPTLKIF